MSAADYERKSHLKYEIFIQNVISCANKQRERCASNNISCDTETLCLLLPFILQFQASGKDPILLKSINLL